MLTEINPKIPMRNKAATKDFYLNKLGFKEFGNADHEGYLMVQKDNIQLHFFEFKELDPKKNCDKCIYEQMILINCTSPCWTKN